MYLKRDRTKNDWWNWVTYIYCHRCGDFVKDWHSYEIKIGDDRYVYKYICNKCNNVAEEFFYSKKEQRLLTNDEIIKIKMGEK